MKVLIVGSGAVGQVYGLALQNSSVELGLFDRAANAEKLLRAREQGGLPLYQVSFAHRKNPVLHRLKDYEVFTEVPESLRFEPDQIWFTVPSQVYYTDWFRDFLRQAPTARVVCFTPEGRRSEFFAQGSGDQVVFGGTTFMAWQGSLENSGGTFEGIHFWRPPLAIPLSGTQNASSEIAQVLKRSGFKVTLGKPDSHSQAAMTAVITAFVAGLELSGWTLRDYHKSPWLGRAAGAGGEAVMGQLPRIGIIGRAFLSNPVLSACFTLAALLLPLLFPFDLQKSLKFHYTKTREQTQKLLEIYLKDSAARGAPVADIQKLVSELQLASEIKAGNR